VQLCLEFSSGKGQGTVQQKGTPVQLTKPSVKQSESGEARGNNPEVPSQAPAPGGGGTSETAQDEDCPVAEHTV